MIVVTPGETTSRSDRDPLRYELERVERMFTPGRLAFLVGFALFCGFWVWALFFASKESVNQIGDRAWTEQAETTCSLVRQEFRKLDLRKSEDMNVRADLVDEGTDLLRQMLFDLMVIPPSDDKGAAIVPLWIADYKALLDRRYDYANALRAGIDEPFTEPPAQDTSIPVTEKLETFAGDNEMASCSPPRAGVLDLRG